MSQGHHPYPHLSAADVRGLLTLWAVDHVEGDALAFLQGLETIHGDCGEMGEKIFTAAIRRDETKTLCVIEPFDGT